MPITAIMKKSSSQGGLSQLALEHAEMKNPFTEEDFLFGSPTPHNSPVLYENFAISGDIMRSLSGRNVAAKPMQQALFLTPPRTRTRQCAGGPSASRTSPMEVSSFPQAQLSFASLPWPKP
eukprot:245885_1